MVFALAGIGIFAGYQKIIRRVAKQSDLSAI